jgi:hypothetical protein
MPQSTLSLESICISGYGSATSSLKSKYSFHRSQDTSFAAFSSPPAIQQSDGVRYQYLGAKVKVWIDTILRRFRRITEKHMREAGDNSQAGHRA